MDTASNGSLTTQICSSLHTQLGSMFECLPAGERVQIRTPFVYPDGDNIDLYWRDTPQGQVISDLGDTYGWLFINGAHDKLTSKQNQAYDGACLTYGVERRDGLLLTYVVDGKLAEAVVRLAQAIMAISQSVDVGQQSSDDSYQIPERSAYASQGRSYGGSSRNRRSSPRYGAYSEAASSKVITGSRITAAINKYNWQYDQHVSLAGQFSTEWTVDFVVETSEQKAVLMALYERRSLGWQKRAIGHAFTVFSDLSPLLEKQPLPHKAISVIDDTDTYWDNTPLEMLRGVSEVVFLSKPDSLPNAIIS